MGQSVSDVIEIVGVPKVMIFLYSRNLVSEVGMTHTHQILE